MPLTAGFRQCEARYAYDYGDTKMDQFLINFSEAIPVVGLAKAVVHAGQILTAETTEEKEKYHFRAQRAAAIILKTHVMGEWLGQLCFYLNPLLTPIVLSLPCRNSMSGVSLLWAGSYCLKLASLPSMPYLRSSALRQPVSQECQIAPERRRSPRTQRLP